jgi:hypothetical protein
MYGDEPRRRHREGSAKNTALLNGRRAADSAPATSRGAAAPRRLRARCSTKLRSVCCRKPAFGCTTRPNPRLRRRRRPRSAAQCAGRTCIRRGQSSAPGARLFYRSVARSIDCPFGLSLILMSGGRAERRQCPAGASVWDHVWSEPSNNWVLAEGQARGVACCTHVVHRHGFQSVVPFLLVCIFTPFRTARDGTQRLCLARRDAGAPVNAC